MFLSLFKCFKEVSMFVDTSPSPRPTIILVPSPTRPPPVIPPPPSQQGKTKRTYKEH